MLLNLDLCAPEKGININQLNINFLNIFADNPERYSTEQIEFNNISVQGVDNIEKEVVEIKISKQKLKRQNKRNKEKGLQYTRNDGTVVSARSIKSACSCRRYCGKKYPDMIRAQLLSNLLQLKMSGQNQFLANHISVINTARPKVYFL